MTAVVVMLKLPDAAAWAALRDRFVVATAQGEAFATGVISVVEVGEVRHTTGRTITVDGMQQPETIAVPGYLVDVIADPAVITPDLYPLCVNPVQPRHQYAGIGILDVPEATEDDGDTVLVRRGVGRAATALERDAAEAEHVRRKIAREEREDRRALHQATLAVVQARTARDVLAEERDRVVAAVDAQRAARDALVAQREAEQQRRDAAIAALATLTGAARQPEVAKREAASAELQRLAPMVTDANVVLARTTEQREDVAARLSAANVEVQRLRTERAAALALVRD